MDAPLWYGPDQRGLHRGGVGRGQADGLARGLDGIIADAEDVVYGVVHNAQEAEQDQHRQQHGHAAAHGVVAMLLLELHQLLLLLLGVVLVLLLDLGDQRLETRNISWPWTSADGMLRGTAAA